jgi:hypothetical protein
VCQFRPVRSSRLIGASLFIERMRAAIKAHPAAFPHSRPYRIMIMKV